MDISQGPLHAYGDLGNLLNAPGQGQASSVAVPDPNGDRGPSLFFAGVGIPDIRYPYLKDKVQGYAGMVPSFLTLPLFQSINQIPATLQTNNIAAAQAVTLNVAMTLAVASTGISVNIPISPFVGYGGLNGQTVVTPGIALDFGFAFATVVSANAQITVADTTKFSVGMPLVIEAVGNAAGTAPLLTNVKSIDSATLLTLVDTPQASKNPAAIGTGNIWGPSENGFPTPTAALPYLAMGPALMFDPRQAVCRGVQISSTDGGSLGGAFLVSGYDVFGMAMTDTITVAAAGAASWATKTFKYITSIVPQFTDPAVYLVGTSDVFGLGMRLDTIENAQATWNLLQVTDGVGVVIGVTTAATSATGDVRGTIQTSTNGGGTPITNANASNGTVVSLAMSGRRLLLSQYMPTSQIVRGLVTDTRAIFGNTQA